MPRRRNGRQNNQAITVRDVPQDEAPYKRLAYVLNKAAEDYPYRFMKKSWLAKHVFGLTRLPDEDSVQAKSISNMISSAKKYLDKIHGRTAFSRRGAGVRATVDDADRAKNVVEGAGRRASSAVRSYTAHVNAIDIRNISDRDLKAFMKKHKGTARSLEPLMAPLALPAPPTDVEE